VATCAFANLNSTSVDLAPEVLQVVIPISCIDAVSASIAQVTGGRVVGRNLRSRVGESPLLLIPLQVKVREFTGKVLLGAVAAERGWTTVVGTHRRLRPAINRYPPGLVLDYSAARPFSPLFRSYADQGHSVAATEEEGLVDHAMHALPDLDAYCAWGPNEAAQAERTALLPREQIHKTGNPRFDLLRPELRGLHRDDTERLRKRYGSYILVNTNFNANVLFGKERLVRTYAQDVVGYDLPIDWFERRDAHSAALFQAFVAMVRAVAERFPDRIVVVRPHPSESSERWQQLVGDVTNVHVELSGNVVPWILGADAVVHQSCTTAIEAAVLGATVVAYRPVRNEEFDWDLPNSVSCEVSTLPELFDALTAAREPLHEPNTPPALAEYVTGTSGPLAAERMMEVFERLDIRPQEFRWGPVRHARAALDVGVITAKHAINRATGRSSTPFSFERQKNPGWDVAEVEATLRTLHDATGRFENVHAFPVSKHVVGITALD